MMGHLSLLHERYREDLDQVEALMIESLDPGELPLVRDMGRYVLGLGGKRIRPLLLIATAHACAPLTGNHYALAAALELMHTATLLHDDVVDASAKRRGQASAPMVWDNKSSVLVGDFLLARSFQIVVATEHLPILRSFSRTAGIMARGEVMQLVSSYDPSLSADAYRQIIASKTAALLSLACEVAGLLSGQPAHVIELLGQFGLTVGTIFQIKDDILDYEIQSTQWGKEVGDDFREGKVTLPFILAFGAASEVQKAALARLLQLPEKTDEALQEALHIFRQTHALEKAQEEVASLAREGQALLSGLASFLPETALLHGIVDFCVERTC